MYRREEEGAKEREGRGVVEIRKECSREKEGVYTREKEGCIGERRKGCRRGKEGVHSRRGKKGVHSRREK